MPIFGISSLDRFDPSDGAHKGLTLSAKMQCLCKPVFRLRTKAPRVCLGYCRGCSVRVGEVEDNFFPFVSEVCLSPVQ